MLIFLVLGGIGLGVTAALAVRTRRFLATCARAGGRITRISMEVTGSAGYGSDHPAETVRWYRPHVEFLSEGGSPVQFASRVAHPRASLYTEGQSVAVVYQRSSPATTAEIAGPAVWRPAILSGVASGALIVFALLARACG